MALNAGGNNLEFPVRSGGLVVWYFLHDFGSVMFPQPGRQLSCSSFPIRDAESTRLGRPPWRNAAVADEFANIEKRTWNPSSERIACTRNSEQHLTKPTLS